MSKLILLNTVTIASPGAGAKKVRGSETLDSVLAAADIPGIQSAGGVLWPGTDALVSAAAAIGQSKIVNKGANEDEVDKIMMCAAIQSAGSQTQLSPQASETTTQPETEIFALQGSGNVIGAYYLPNASSAPAAPNGTNNIILLLNIYNASGTLVGQLASGTLNNSNQMTAKVRFSLGAITNGLYADGFTVTATITVTGTATLPAGDWVLLTQA
jgi:hypothetical protein